MVTKQVRSLALIGSLTLLVSLVIASDATRDIPALYGHRHTGLEYSAMYPRLR